MLSQAKKYAIVSDRLLTNPHEGLILGNGDLGAIVTFLSHEIILDLGKNDIWDSRISSPSEDTTLKHDDLIRYQKNFDFQWLENCDNVIARFAKWDGQPEGMDVVYGSLAEEKERCGRIIVNHGGFGLRRAGRIRIRHSGFSNTKVHTKLDIANGLLEADVDLGRSLLRFDAFIHRDLNVLAMKLSVKGDTVGIQAFVEKEPDYCDRTTPLPEVELLSEHSGVISQLIPAKYGTPDFSWHLAANFPDSVPMGKGDEAPVLDMAYAMEQCLAMADGQEITLTAAVVTDRDHVPEPKERAARLVRENSPERFDRMLSQSEASWKKYWDASAIELEDKELEAVWYRNLYGYACHIKEGAQAPSLCANIPIEDNSDFHSRYTWNHNVQKWFAPALSVNHLEWYEVFAELIRQHMPTFEYLSEMIFGLEGVYCDLSSIPFAPADRAITNNKWGRALAMTGWLSLMLWQHWEYTHDAKWLAEKGYDYIKKAARFYSGYLKKYQNEDGDIYPSMRLEEPGWCKDFVGNRNHVTDLVMFKKALECAVKASEVLGADEEEREDWKAALKKVPAVPYGWTEDGQGWYAYCKDWDKYDSVIRGRRISEYADLNWRIEYGRTNRWGCGGWLVYPGEYVDGDEEGGITEAVRDMLSRTDLKRPKGTSTPSPTHSISAMVPFVRLGIAKKYDELRDVLLDHCFENGMFADVAYREGQLLVWSSNNWRIVENQFQGIMCITEMLLQSQGGKIRLFPYWPKEKAASFAGFRARGGFLVSAEKDGNGLKSAEIVSAAGETCRIKWTEKRTPSVTEDGKAVPFELGDQTLIFETEPSKTYQITVK